MPNTRAAPSAPALRFANALARRELLPWILLGVTLGLVEGGTAAVLVKQHFSGAGSTAAVNFAVSVVSAAPTIANVLSFAWANLGHGRARVPLLVSLQLLFALTVGLIGLAPNVLGGLLFTVLSILAARIVWAGILTLRSSVWIANYPRNTLARMTGRVVVGGSLMVALTSALVSAALQSGAIDTKRLYMAAALAGMAAAFLYRRTRLRREFRLLDSENLASGTATTFSLRVFREILRTDRAFRDYMLWMGVYGAGSVMMTSQLIVIMTDQLHIPSQQQIMMLTVIPMLTLPVFVPFWARIFDRQHTVTFRSQQGWVMVGAYVLSSIGVLFAWPPGLWAGAILLGAALAGASFGWNLGHQDFAAPGRAQQYMGVHVTLAGLRGMIAPPFGMLCYQGLEAWHGGAGRFSILLPTAVTAAGALGFNYLRKQHYISRKQESSQ
jgi:hypothetical protein